MTAPYYSDDRVTVHAGDCLDVLATLPDASVDAVVTDPPYGLANTTPAQVADTITRWVNGERDYLPSGRGFMGKEWDGFVPPVAVWDECLRVLKPGGHMAVFAGSRTQDLMGLSIRLAGFDLRDSVAYLFGSGFPKSLDVSKAIDKRRDDTEDVRVVCRWLRARIDEHPTESVRTIAARFGFHPRMVEHWAARDTDSQPTLPTLDQWDALREVLDFTDEMDAEVLRLNLRKGEPGEAWADRPVTGQVEEWDNRVNYAITSRDGLRRDIPATPEAERWQGWGTALKPGHEPIILARKPFPSTVAANVLEWGTGALNIDGCRIGTSEELRRPFGTPSDHVGQLKSLPRGELNTGSDRGRWPANVALDETQAEALDQQSGQLTSGANPTRRGSDKFRDAYGTSTGQEECTPARGTDQGGASRFFYTAKADSNERPRIDGVAHPTVKPLDLMRWLVRLVTPPGGKVLDPFAGSGTTGEAALLEGFLSILIERETEFLPLITQRIHRRIDPVEAIRQAGGDLGLFELDYVKEPPRND